MGYILRLAYSLTDNYLFAIFLFTLVMEILLSPLAIKQQKNSIKQAKLGPKTAAIRKKYAGRTDQATQQKMNEEIMAMYKSENFSPTSGCGTLLIQFPIIICLYNVITQPLKYICRVPTAEITALTEFFKNNGMELDLRNIQIQIINLVRGNVDNYTSIAPSLKNAVIPDFTVGPFDLSQTPEISFTPFNWLMLIPIITFVVMIVSQKLMQKLTYQPPESADAQQSASMKILMYTTPLMSVYFEFQLAAAIGVYWIFRNILQLAEKAIISKLYPVPRFTEEDYKEAERLAGMSERQKKKELTEANANRPHVRSLHHIDDEEYLARHPEERVGEGEWLDKKALEEKEKAKNTTELTDSDIIKDDEKSSYRKKKSK